MKIKSRTTGKTLPRGGREKVMGHKRLIKKSLKRGDSPTGPDRSHKEELAAHRKETTLHQCVRESLKKMGLKYEGKCQVEREQGGSNRGELGGGKNVKKTK